MGGKCPGSTLGSSTKSAEISKAGKLIRWHFYWNVTVKVFHQLLKKTFVEQAMLYFDICIYVLKTIYMCSMCQWYLTYHYCRWEIPQCWPIWKSQHLLLRRNESSFQKRSDEIEKVSKYGSYTWHIWLMFWIKWLIPSKKRCPIFWSVDIEKTTTS